MANDVFMKIEGPDVKGESTDSKHLGQIELLTFSWGGHVSILRFTDDAGANATDPSPGGRATYMDFTFTKNIDLSSPVLLSGFSNYRRYKKITIEVRKAGGTQIVYDQIILENVVISSYTHSRSGADDTVVENLSMAYGLLTLSYWPQSISGARGTVVSTQVDTAVATR